MNYVLRTVDKKVKSNIIHCVHGNEAANSLQKGYARENGTAMQDYFSFKFTNPKI
jgi:hypothetical protein